MHLDSVRELKRGLREPLRPRGAVSPQDAPAVSVPAERLRDVAPAQPGIALGIAPTASPRDYRLAVRIQHRDLVDSARLAQIEDAARGEVDVRYIGRLLKQAHENDRRRRPVPMGVSVGHYAITAGTIGAFVRLADDDRPRLLSNNHVLADENRGEPGDAIVQPGPLDGGQPIEDRIGVLERFVAVDPAAVNEVDAALALLDEEIEILAELEGIGAVEGLASAEEVERVIKRGRTTGLTRGSVTAIEVDNVVVDFSTGALRFDGQIEISGGGDVPFSMGGDSGSLIVEQDTRKAVGLLFAGSDQGGPSGTGVTYANPLTTVFERLSVVGLW